MNTKAILFPVYGILAAIIVLIVGFQVGPFLISYLTTYLAALTASSFSQSGTVLPLVPFLYNIGLVLISLGILGVASYAGYMEFKHKG